MSLLDLGRTVSVTIVPDTVAPILNAFRMDAALSVTQSNPGSVFRHPVQSGREGITDAVRIDPDVLTVTGIVSDIPTSLAAIASPPKRAARMYDLLVKMREQRIPLLVITSWTGVLANRWVSQIDATRSQTTGGAIELSLTIEKLRIVTTGLVPAQVDADVLLLGMQTVNVSF